jgi:hypothetical protein
MTTRFGGMASWEETLRSGAEALSVAKEVFEKDEPAFAAVAHLTRLHRDSPQTRSDKALASYTLAIAQLWALTLS